MKSDGAHEGVVSRLQEQGARLLDSVSIQTIARERSNSMGHDALRLFEIGAELSSKLSLAMLGFWYYRGVNTSPDTEKGYAYSYAATIMAFRPSGNFLSTFNEELRDEVERLYWRNYWNLINDEANDERYDEIKDTIGTNLCVEITS